MRNRFWLLGLIVLFCPLGARAQSSATAVEPTLTPVSTGTTQPTPSQPYAATPTVPKTEGTTLSTEAGKSSKADSPAVTGKTPTGASDATPTEKTRPFSIVRFEKPPVIDGNLDDEVWKHATLFQDFYQIQPGDNIEPSQATQALIGYDAQYLYIAFRALDDPAKVRATVAKRDDVFDDDNVRVMLDTFNDKRRAYVLVFNPLGVQADAVATEGAPEDYSVDIVMNSKGMLTKDGYTVEVAIPFKSLRYEAGKDKLWGIHLFRRIKRFNNELDSWMPISRDKSSMLIQAGHIKGFEGLATERALEIIPSLTISETGKRVRALPFDVTRANPALLDPGHFVNQPLHMEPGLTMKLGITPTVTLDMAINPDFAQVEADELVVTANQRFPIFYAERRPFFLEGIDIFRTPLTPVHTRAIVDPDVAVKLSGKLGRNTFGLLMASDNAPGNFSEEERTDPLRRTRLEKFFDKNATIGVLRLKRDVGKDSSIGMIATTYNFIENYNHLLGVDGRFRLNKQTTFDFQLLGTRTHRRFYDPDTNRNDLRTGNALGYYWALNNIGRNFSYALTGQGFTRDYRANVGFTQRTNTNRETLLLRHVTTPKPKARLVSWEVYNFSHIDFDWQGRMQIWESEFESIFNLSRQSYIGAGFEIGYERVFEEEFGPNRTAKSAGAFAGEDSERSSNKRHFFLYGGAKLNKKYSFEFATTYRKGHFDYDFGAGSRYPRVSPTALALGQNAPYDPGSGNLLEANASFIFQPTNALRTSLDYTKSRLVRHDNGRVAFDDNIVSSRTTYQFTRFLFARARLDYSTLEARVRGQFLLGWTPNPGTAFYVGYNDDLNRNGFNPFTGQPEPGLQRNGRTFFIKLSYLFRRSF